MASAEDFPGFIWSAAVLISEGVKGVCSILVKFAAISLLIPDAASPPNNSAKIPKIAAKEPRVLGLELLKSSKNFWDL